MKKIYYKDKEVDILDAFNIDLNSKYFISLIGGGGKTTTLLDLSRAFISKGKKSIIMTTTNMVYPNCKVYNVIDEQLINALENESEIWIGEAIYKKDGMKKLSSPSDELLDFIYNNMDKYNYFILNEADGARKKPIKVPRYYEPVIDKRTNIVIAVLGMESYGSKISDVSARIDDMCTFLGKDSDNLFDEEDLIKIISSKNGYIKDVATNMMYKVLLNKADLNFDIAFKLRNELCKKGYDTIISRI